MAPRKYTLEHRLEDPLTRQKLQNFAPEWKPPSEVFSRDRRHIHGLAPVTRLPTPSSRLERKGAGGATAAAAHKKDQGKGWTIKSMRKNLEKGEDTSAVQEVEDAFFKNVSGIRQMGVESHEARRFLVHEDEELVRKMDNLDENLHRRHAALRKKLDSLGVFSKETNAVRKRAIHTVELRRRMEGNAIRRGDVGSSAPTRVPGQLDSLEAKLQYFLHSISALDQPPRASGGLPLPKMGRPLASERTGSGGSGPGGIRSQSKKMELPPEVIEARQREAEAACAEMVSRYRRRVDDERSRILVGMGIDPANAGDLDLDPEGGVAKEESAQAKTRATRGDERRPYQSTGDLVAEALSRINQSTKKLEEAREGAALKAAEEARAKAEAEERGRYWDEVRRERKMRVNAALGLGGGDGGGDGGEGGGGEEEDDVGGPPPRPRGSEGHKQAGSRQTTPGGGRSRAGQGKGDDGAGPSGATAGRGGAGGGSVSRSQSRNTRISFQGGGGPGGGGGAEDAVDAMDDADLALGEDGFPKLPPLPALVVDEGMALAEVLLQRLERIWGLLRMPVMQKLDMVIKYTSRELSPYMEEALECWETAAACVIARERSVQTLDDFQAKSLADGAVPAHLRVVHQKLQLQLDAATTHVMNSSDTLLAEFGDQITYEGLPYPGVDEHLAGGGALYPGVGGVGGAAGGASPGPEPITSP